MANILTVAGRVLCILFSVILSILIWKTAEYFDTLPEADKNKPLIAWDVLVLCCMMLYLVIRLVLT